MILNMVSKGVIIAKKLFQTIEVILNSNSSKNYHHPTPTYDVSQKETPGACEENVMTVIIWNVTIVESLQNKLITF